MVAKNDEESAPLISKVRTMKCWLSCANRLRKANAAKGMRAEALLTGSATTVMASSSLSPQSPL